MKIFFKPCLKNKRWMNSSIHDKYSKTIHSITKDNLKKEGGEKFLRLDGLYFPMESFIILDTKEKEEKYKQWSHIIV